LALLEFLREQVARRRRTVKRAVVAGTSVAVGFALLIGVRAVGPLSGPQVARTDVNVALATATRSVATNVAPPTVEATPEPPGPLAAVSADSSAPTEPETPIAVSPGASTPRAPTGEPARPLPLPPRERVILPLAGPISPPAPLTSPSRVSLPQPVRSTDRSSAPNPPVLPLPSRAVHPPRDVPPPSAL